MDESLRHIRTVTYQILKSKSTCLHKSGFFLDERLQGVAHNHQRLFQPRSQDPCLGFWAGQETGLVPESSLSVRGPVVGTCHIPEINNDLAKFKILRSCRITVSVATQRITISEATRTQFEQSGVTT